MLVNTDARKHTEAEESWVKEKLAIHGRLTDKVIRVNGICEEYDAMFGKKLTSSGMYTWSRFVADPEFKKRWTDMNREAKKRRVALERENPINAIMPSIGVSNSTSKKERGIFEKSEFVTYSTAGVIGFEDEVGLMKFMSDNKVSENSMNIFKKISFKVDYKVSLVDSL